MFNNTEEALEFGRKHKGDIALMESMQGLCDQIGSVCKAILESDYDSDDMDLTMRMATKVEFIDVALREMDT